MKTDKPIAYGVGHTDYLAVHAKCWHEYETDTFRTDGQIPYMNTIYYDTRDLDKKHCAHCKKLIEM